jgi:vacuolar-type H+-ATPase subunit E/Vma4
VFKPFVSDASDVARLKEIIQEAISRLDERLKSAASNKGDKKVEQIKSDVRQLILLGGTKNAQLAAAQDRIVHLGEIVGQFYGELTSGTEKTPEQQRAQQLQTTLRALAEQNSEQDGKR